LFRQALGPAWRETSGSSASAKARARNAAVALALLEERVERGLDPARARLFRHRRLQGAAQGGHPGLRGGVSGAALPQPQDAQRSRPRAEDVARLARAVLRAAWTLSEKDGKARIKQFASWVENEHPAAGGSGACARARRAVTRPRTRAHCFATPLREHHEPQPPATIGTASCDPLKVCNPYRAYGMIVGVRDSVSGAKLDSTPTAI